MAWTDGSVKKLNCSFNIFRVILVINISIEFHCHKNNHGIVIQNFASIERTGEFFFAVFRVLQHQTKGSPNKKWGSGFLRGSYSLKRTHDCVVRRAIATAEPWESTRYKYWVKNGFNTKPNLTPIPHPPYPFDSRPKWERMQHTKLKKFSDK